MVYIFKSWLSIYPLFPRVAGKIWSLLLVLFYIYLTFISTCFKKCSNSRIIKIFVSLWMSPVGAKNGPKVKHKYSLLNRTWKKLQNTTSSSFFTISLETHGMDPLFVGGLRILIMAKNGTTFKMIHHIIFYYNAKS